MALLRKYFAGHGILEVITPSLVSYDANDTNIQSLSTDGGYLITSPEHEMKELIAEHGQDCYQIAKVFRQESSSSRYHLVDFTMVEWYRVGLNYKQMIDHSVELLQYVGLEYRSQAVSFNDLIKNTLGVDIVSDSLLEASNDLGLMGESHTNTQLLDFLYSRSVRNFKNENIYVVTHFPIHLANLSAPDPNNAEVCLRFEVFVGSMELVNGAEELIDGQEYIRRMSVYKPEAIVNHRLVEAMRSLSLLSGTALGFDRLLMALYGIDDIKELL